jgi:hypothetical protein
MEQRIFVKYKNKLIDGNTANVNETNFKDINYVVLTLFGPFGNVQHTFLFIRTKVCVLN